MTAFTMQVSQNQFLAPGSDLVHAVVSVTAAPSTATGPPRGQLVEAFLVDCSRSMEGPKLKAAKEATAAAIDLLPEDAWFCVIAGAHTARLLAPLARTTPGNKRAAKAAVSHLKADGGTAMSTWLDVARLEFAKVADGIHHALLLTDGKNESEEPAALQRAVERCEGRFQCDARGVGTDWEPEQLRTISGRLLGTVDIIPRAEEIAADFSRVIESAAGKSVGDAALRVWTPQTGSVQFCRQVHPEHVDLTDRAKPDTTNPRQVRDYPTGAWGAERRDYHLCFRVAPGQVGQRMCAARVGLVIAERGQAAKAAEAMVLAVWTDDETRSAVIDPSVAHYTGQTELADSIRLGLKARADGDGPRAEQLLGRAVQIAAETHPETMELLKKVVTVEDERQGSVKLRTDVNKEDEFALDTRSTKTARVNKDS